MIHVKVPGVAVVVEVDADSMRVDDNRLLYLNRAEQATDDTVKESVQVAVFYEWSYAILEPDQEEEAPSE